MDECRRTPAAAAAESRRQAWSAKPPAATATKSDRGARDFDVRLGTLLTSVMYVTARKLRWPQHQFMARVQREPGEAVQRDIRDVDDRSPVLAFALDVINGDDRVRWTEASTAA